MAWTFDAPLGVYRDHALSTNIRREAMFDVQFMKFARPEPGYGKGRGQSLTITRFNQLPLAGRVNEMDVLPDGRPAETTKSVTVGEWGFKTKYTEFEKNLTYFDITNPLQAMLRDQMSHTMDKMVADAAKLTPIKYRPMLAGAVITTNGAFSGVADKNLDVNDLRDIYDRLRNFKVPHFRNNKYVGILSTRAARGIKNDPEYKDWLAPTTSEPFTSGILKDIEGFSLYETNFPSSLADLAGTSTVLGEAVFFGADALALAVIDDPELRMAPVPEDLGRFREFGWVGTLEAFTPWDEAARPRIIHVGSN